MGTGKCKENYRRKNNRQLITVRLQRVPGKVCILSQCNCVYELWPAEINSRAIV